MFYAKAVWQYLCARFDIDPDDDRGMTTETAVLLFVLVTAAIAVGGIIAVAAQDTAESIPVPEGA